jgi:hypothetical protein
VLNQLGRAATRTFIAAHGSYRWALAPPPMPRPLQLRETLWRRASNRRCRCWSRTKRKAYASARRRPEPLLGGDFSFWLVKLGERRTWAVYKFWSIPKMPYDGTLVAQLSAVHPYTASESGSPSRTVLVSLHGWIQRL